MAKIKLTAEQTKMIQEFEKIEYESTPKFMKPAEKLTRNFKKQGKDIEGFKAENEKLTGHPIAGDGGDEYNPQTEKENQKTFMNEGLMIELMEFSGIVLQTLKEMLINPTSFGLLSFWVNIGFDRRELSSLMSSIGLIRRDVSGRILVNSKDLKNRVKRLYHEVKNKQQEESFIAMGDDIEMLDDDVDLAKQGQTKDEFFKSLIDDWFARGNDHPAVRGLYDVGKYVRAWITLRSLQDNKHVAEDGGYPAGAAKDSDAPYNQDIKMTTPYTPEGKELDVVYYNNEMAILANSKKQLFFFYIDHIDKKNFAEYAEREEIFTGRDEDGDPSFDYGDFEIDGEVIERYVNDNLNSLNWGTTFDEYQSGIDLIKINNEIAVDILKTWGSDENLRKLFKIATTKESKLYTKGQIVEKKMSPNFTKLKDKNGRIRKLTKKNVDYKASEGEEKCGSCKYFKENKCAVVRGVIDKEMTCNYFEKKGETSETTVAGAAGDGGSSGPYVTPKMWAKDKKNWGNANKTMYPSGQIVQNPLKNESVEIIFTKEQFKMLKENFEKTQWPDGEFVEFDDCVKYNNNKDAENGGCSQGAVDGVVKTSKSGESVISKEGLYYEVAKKTGRTIEEVKNIIENHQ